jgi:phage protein D
MKNIIDHGSLNVHPGFFSLDEFIESDAPGTLSWLYLDADDLDSDVQDQQIKTFDKTKVGDISIHETR